MSGWVPLHKGLSETFSEIRREYSRIEAMFSLSLDVNSGKSRSLRAYSRMWGWSTNKTKRFLEMHGIEETLRKQKGNTKETSYSVILLDKSNMRKQKGNRKETLRKHEYKEQEQEQEKEKDIVHGLDVFERIISCLNEKTGRTFKSKTEATKRLIRARLSEGFTEDDFYSVIDKKVSSWSSDQKMSKFLRPQTLFGTKFEAYLQEGLPNGKEATSTGYVEATGRRTDEEWLQ